MVTINCFITNILKDIFVFNRRKKLIQVWKNFFIFRTIPLIVQYAAKCFFEQHLFEIYIFVTLKNMEKLLF